MLYLTEYLINNLKFLPYNYLDETTYFVLILRRKWLEKNYETDFINGIKLRGKGYIINRWEVQNPFEEKKYFIFEKELSVLYSNFNYLKVRGENFLPVKLIAKHYTNSISLMFSYQPKNILKAFSMFTVNCVKKLINIKTSKLSIVEEWLNCLEKSQSRRINFVLLDFDNNKDIPIKDILYTVKSFLRENNLLKDFRYSVTTPSGGLHVVLEINNENSVLLFKKENKEKITLFFKEKGLDLEVKTRNFLTHLPFLNPSVVVCNSLFEEN